MTRWIAFPVFFLVSELLLALFFQWAAARLYRKPKKKGLDGRSILKGMVERLFLLISLANGYHHALTLFSAVKLATRLKHDEPKGDGAGDKGSEDRFNDYYLIGNFISVVVAMGYVHLWLDFR